MLVSNNSLIWFNIEFYKMTVIPYTEFIGGEEMSTEQKALIGCIISQHRNEMKLTQLELACKSGLSRSYVADIEAGRYAPSVKSLVSIANVLNMDINFLLEMTEIQWKIKGVVDLWKNLYLFIHY